MQNPFFLHHFKGVQFVQQCIDMWYIQKMAEVTQTPLEFLAQLRFSLLACLLARLASVAGVAMYVAVVAYLYSYVHSYLYMFSR
jgi:hypothetical protein